MYTVDLYFRFKSESLTTSSYNEIMDWCVENLSDIFGLSWTSNSIDFMCEEDMIKFKLRFSDVIKY